MCGILAVLGKKDPKRVKELSSRMSHRGGDQSGIYVNESGFVLSHERLSIIDIHSGIQPIQGTDSAYVIHNGEIYNHHELKQKHFHTDQFRTKSDSEIIVRLYEKMGAEFLNLLDGVFALVVIDEDKYLAARDPIGVKSMYYGTDKNGIVHFASEIKALIDECSEIAAFPPGHYYTPETGFVKYYFPKWEDASSAIATIDYKKLKDSLIKATQKRLMSDVPLGVLLSGGLDSSLTSSIAARILKEKGKKLHSFSIGLDAQAPDLKAAKKVADFIGTEHHEIHFTVKEGIEIIHKLIWHLETYDITSIRASTPMYFLSEAIKKAGIKVVLSGEGADEILGGYLYFKNAPSQEEFQLETIDRVKKLSTADCLRADKSTMAHGLEARVPFLDKEFLETAMEIAPEFKMAHPLKDNLEKYVLRQAFDDKEDPYLPQEILWRQKEQFSDGVGYSWIDELKAYCELQVSDQEMLGAKKRFPINSPDTKEAYYMRSIFEEHFPGDAAAKTVKKWIPKWQNDKDPSGRASESHLESYEELVY